MRELLTPRETEILDLLAKVDSVKLVALRLHIKTKTVYNILYRLRKKRLMARKFINQLLNYRKQGVTLESVLTPRIKLREPTEEELEEPLAEGLEEKLEEDLD